MATRKVLLVDDDPDIRKIGRLSLTGVAKWEVHLASSCAEALELASAERPDVILLDSTMGAEDSYQTLSKLHLSTDTPVIMTAVKMEERELSQLMGLGAKGVISKPFNPRTLPSEIDKILS